MNIVFTQHPDPRVQGLAQAIASINPTTFMWDNNQKPLFDVLYDNNINVIFYHDEETIAKTISMAQAEFPETQFVLLKFNSLLPHNSSPDLTLVMEQSTIGGPLFLDYFTNLVDLRNKKYLPKYDSEVVVFTDGLDPNESMFSLCLRTLCYNFKTKIYGQVPFHFPYYLGKLDPTDYADALFSSKVLVGFENSRLRDALFCSCHPLIYQGIDPHSFSSLDDLLLKCRSAIDSPPTNDWTLDTYHDIVVKIFTKLEHPKVVEAALEYKAGVLV